MQDGVRRTNLHVIGTLRSLSNLAVLLQNFDRLEEAEPLFWRALEGCKAVLGTGHPVTLKHFARLVDLLKKSGKREDAFLLEKASPIAAVRKLKRKVRFAV